MTLTLAYCTSRKDCRLEWTLDSLRNQMSELPGMVARLIIIDFYRGQRALAIPADYPVEILHVAPKPTVWQGSHRLTKEDYFAAASSRNCALCHCATDWIAHTDDLSVLMPGWLSAVKDAMDGNYIAFGAYKKVNNLVVENGIAVSYKENPSGIDSRWPKGADAPVPCSGEWLYGCSLAGPTEAFLTVGGWDERADACGMGSEDTMMGIMLGKRGYHCKYDRRMLTLESDELHHVERPLKRVIQKRAGREDASWALLNMVRQDPVGFAPNYFPEGGIRAVRDKVLAGGTFPTSQIPDRDWYSGKLLSEL